MRKAPVDIQQLKSKVSLEFKDFKIKESEAKKYLEQIEKNNLEEIHFKLDSSIFLFDEIVYPYFQKIMDEIVGNNELLKQIKPTLFISRELTPNAYAMGNGIMVFNLSLIQHLDNESQIAFIICHELAHNYLRHVFADAEKEILAYLSKSTQDELKRLKKQEYNVYEDLKKLSLNLNMQAGRFSRTSEMEADSLGLIFLSKTKYALKESPSALNAIDSLLEKIYADSIRLDKYFNFPNYPFKPNWVKEPEAFIMSDDSTKKDLEDSLSTHPDIAIRVEILKNIMKNYNLYSGSTFLQDSLLFLKIKEIARFEMIINAEVLHRYDRSIYYILKLMEDYPDNIFLKQGLYYYFQKLTDAYNHQSLMDFIGVSSNFHHKDYKILVRFLNNLRMSEMTRITNEIKLNYLKN